MKATLLLSFAICALSGQTPYTSGGTPFDFSTETKRTLIWGERPGVPRVFFRPDLPALFVRSIAFDTAFPPGTTLDWIFTGDEGGFTVRLSANRVRLVQRYYDSAGLVPAAERAGRYPEKIREESERAFTGKPQILTVTMDHRFSLLVALNGNEILRQKCLLDVRRHQLAWTPAADGSAGRVAGRMLEPQTLDTRVRVNAGNKHQAILGFGGITSAPAYAQLSAEGKQQWWKLLLEYNLLLHREYPNGNNLKPDLSNLDTPGDATPHYYGDNFPNGEISDFEYIKQIRRLGGRVLFEFWELPVWARQEYSALDGKTYPRAAKVGEYVRAMVEYCRISQKKTGHPPDIVGVQNEIVQPAEIWHQMILALREGLDQAGFRAVKIHMPDHSRLDGAIRTASAIKQSPKAWGALDFAATHLYDYQSFFQDPDGYDARIQTWKETVGDKPFLSTEFTVNDSAYQSRSYRTAFAQAQLYHKNMAIMNASALLYCWTILDVEQPSFGATRSLFVPDRSNNYQPAPSSYQLRVFGAFSRRVREGMTRVDAASTNTDLLVTAYSGAGAKRTVILVNRSTSPHQVSVDWPGAAFAEQELVSPYHANYVTVAAPGPVTVRPGELMVLSNVPLRQVHGSR
jgi:O-glycosyl hydrolase